MCDRYHHTQYVPCCKRGDAGGNSPPRGLRAGTENAPIADLFDRSPLFLRKNALRA